MLLTTGRLQQSVQKVNNNRRRSNFAMSSLRLHGVPLLTFRRKLILILDTFTSCFIHGRASGWAAYICTSTPTVDLQVGQLPLAISVVWTLKLKWSTGRKPSSSLFFFKTSYLLAWWRRGSLRGSGCNSRVAGTSPSGWAPWWGWGSSSLGSCQSTC